MVAHVEVLDSVRLVTMSKIKLVHQLATFFLGRPVYIRRRIRLHLPLLLLFLLFRLQKQALLHGEALVVCPNVLDHHRDEHFDHFFK